MGVSRSRGLTAWRTTGKKRMRYEIIYTQELTSKRSVTQSVSRRHAESRSFTEGNQWVPRGGQCAPWLRSKSAKWGLDYGSSWLRNKGQYSSPPPVCVCVPRLSVSLFLTYRVSTLGKNKKTHIFIIKYYDYSFFHSFIMVHNTRMALALDNSRGLICL